MECMEFVQKTCNESMVLWNGTVILIKMLGEFTTVT
jgi:hypothetical protein